jgi:hypothetical protein
VLPLLSLCILKIVGQSVSSELVTDGMLATEWQMEATEELLKERGNGFSFLFFFVDFFFFLFLFFVEAAGDDPAFLLFRC